MKRKLQIATSPKFCAIYCTNIKTFLDVTSRISWTLSGLSFPIGSFHHGPRAILDVPTNISEQEPSLPVTGGK
jgi:hypothetical protein